ncbi:MAG TPA: hypothetical protein VKY22_08960 [Bradyrhizobium sp.]|nr:hypothetical protein [Bradyrhizobium sp.]
MTYSSRPPTGSGAEIAPSGSRQSGPEALELPRITKPARPPAAESESAMLDACSSIELVLSLFVFFAGH